MKELQKGNYFTTLVCLPMFSNFSDYLDLVYLIEEMLNNTRLNEKVQIATFHPKYQFLGTSSSDVTNLTNRSPVPMVHILLVGDVKEAINSYSGNTEDIWRKNVETMRSIYGEKKEPIE